MPMVTYPLNNIEYTAEDAELFHITRESGIYAKNSFDYSITGADNNIVIGKGIGWIKNSEFSGKVIAQKEPISLNMGLPDSVYPRIDAIVIRFDANSNETDIVVKQGSATSSPIAPKVVQTESIYELHLYHVRREAGSLYITPNNITDLRLNKLYCGLMADSVTSVDTAAINAQVMALIERLREDITAAKDGSAYMMRDGSVPMTGFLPMGNHRVTEVAAPEEDGDAVNLGYANALSLNNNALVIDNYINDVLAVDLNNADSPVNCSGYFDAAYSVNCPPDAVYGVRKVIVVIPGILLIVEARCFMTDGTSRIWRHTYNVNDGGWIGWDAVYDYRHKPTAADIGAAPAGYGLGGNGEPKNWSEIDNLIANGKYQISNINQTINGIPVVSATLEVIYYGYNYGKQILRTVETASGSSVSYTLERSRGYSGWGAWGCDNPPMENLVEYLTTERFLGKAVYCKMVSCGALVSAGSSKTVGMNVVPTRIIRHCGFVKNDASGDVVSLPIFDKTIGADIGYHIVNEGNIYMVCATDATKYTSSWVILWYTKD